LLAALLRTFPLSLFLSHLDRLHLSASYHSSPPGRPWPPAMLCFKCFRCMFEVFHLDIVYVAMVIYACYKHMFQVFLVFQTYVSSVSSGCCRSISKCCITCMLQVHVSSVSYVCSKYFIQMLQK
jgi:hypothetical protein